MTKDVGNWEEVVREFYKKKSAKKPKKEGKNSQKSEIKEEKTLKKAKLNDENSPK